MTAKEQVLIYECISGGGLGASAGPGSELLAQGVAMRDALAADLQGLESLAVSCVASREAPLGAGLCAVRTIPAPSFAPDRTAKLATNPAFSASPNGAAIDPQTLDFLGREAQRYDRVWVIAPESDDLLARFANVVGAKRWVGCSLSAIRLAASKNATRARLAARGVTVADAWSVGAPEPETDGCWVVKPDDGAGSVDTILHRNFETARDDYLARLAAGRASTLEAWIDGTPLSLSLLCAGGEAELLSINRQRIHARPGEALRYDGVDIQAMPIDSPSGETLSALAQKVLAAVPGLEGYVGIDLVWRSRGAADRRPAGPVVIEINPRLTCAYVGLSAALGRNLGGEILRAAPARKHRHALH